MNVRSSITHLFFAAGFECSATYTIVITAPAEHTRHHRAAPVSAFTRVFDALWARDPVIQLLMKRMIAGPAMTPPVLMQWRSSVEGVLKQEVVDLTACLATACVRPPCSIEGAF